jgi:hypothetical protein
MVSRPHRRRSFPHHPHSFSSGHEHHLPSLLASCQGRPPGSRHFTGIVWKCHRCSNYPFLVSTTPEAFLAKLPCPSPSYLLPHASGSHRRRHGSPECHRRHQAPSPKLLPPPHHRPGGAVSFRRLHLAQPPPCSASVVEVKTSSYGRPL